MLVGDPRKSLRIILENCGRILEYTDNLNWQAYLQDYRSRDAIELCIRRIISAASSLSGHQGARFDETLAPIVLSQDNPDCLPTVLLELMCNGVLRDAIRTLQTVTLEILSCPTGLVRDVNPLPDYKCIRAQSAQRLSNGRHGIVHVGAYAGEELEAYIAAGFRRILLVEANPDVIPRLLSHVEFWNNWLSRLEEIGLLSDRHPSIQVCHCIAGEQAGIAEFYVTKSAMQSSMLSPSNPELSLDRTVQIRMLPLPGILEELSWPINEVGVLVVDVQGAELKVLRGAEELLRHLQSVIVEVNWKDRYIGQCSFEELDSFLKEHKFLNRRFLQIRKHSADVMYSAIYD